MERKVGSGGSLMWKGWEISVNEGGEGDEEMQSWMERIQGSLAVIG